MMITSSDIDSNSLLLKKTNRSCVAKHEQEPLGLAHFQSTSEAVPKIDLSVAPNCHVDQSTH